MLFSQQNLATFFFFCESRKLGSSDARSCHMGSLAFDHNPHRADQGSVLSPRFERACTGCIPRDICISCAQGWLVGPEHPRSPNFCRVQAWLPPPSFFRCLANCAVRLVTLSLPPTGLIVCPLVHDASLSPKQWLGLPHFPLSLLCPFSGLSQSACELLPKTSCFPHYLLQTPHLPSSLYEQTNRQQSPAKDVPSLTGGQRYHCWLLYVDSTSKNTDVKVA